MKNTRIILAGCCALALLALTAGCNTVKGVGEDVQAAGEAVSDGAQKTGDAIKGEN